jgi:hypothetical protein
LNTIYKYLLLLLLAIPAIAFSQYSWEVGGGLGASNYLGEIGGNEGTARPWILDMKLGQSRQVVNGYVRYRFNEYFNLRADLTYGRLQGADSLSANPARFSRNLSFRNDIVELAARIEYPFIYQYDVGSTGRYLLNFHAFVFAGAAVFYNNPKANYKDKWVRLQPLQTEGVKYGKIQASFPVGVGFYYTYKKQHRFGWEMAWRFTLTDYIDDVSKTYPRDTSGMSATAQALSNRNPELNIDPSDPRYINPYNYGPATPDQKNENPRGDNGDRDSYIFTTFSYGYILKGKYKNKKFSTSKRGSVNVGSYKRKKRRTRAKF